MHGPTVDVHRVERIVREIIAEYGLARELGTAASWAQQPT